MVEKRNADSPKPEMTMPLAVARYTHWLSGGTLGYIDRSSSGTHIAIWPALRSCVHRADQATIAAYASEKAAEHEKSKGDHTDGLSCRKTYVEEMADAEVS